MQLPDVGIVFLATIEWLDRSFPVKERIVCYISDDDGQLKTEGGEDIGWDVSAITSWVHMPPAPWKSA